VEDRLLAAVEREYAALAPRSSASWPDPHEGGSPSQDEYSRVTEPARYRIVGARADAWARALVSLELATEERTDAPAGWRGPVGATASRLVPHAAGALPLIVVRGEFENTPDTVVVLHADAAEPLYLGIEPDCGCDARDRGSEDLLEAIDDLYIDVIAGDFVHVSGPGWTARAGRNRWETSGDVPDDMEKVFADATAGRPTPFSVVTGAAWWCGSPAE